MITEKEYIKVTSLEHRKLYAQFFTPEQIADFMSQWVLEEANGNENILEPAFGLGVFSRTMAIKCPGINVQGYDIDETIIQFAKKNISEINCAISLQNENYLTASWEDKYDGIICNPPYLKFHDYDNSSLVPLVNSKLGTKLNGFTNIYTLFLLKSIYQLKEGGRLAYIIPSEFLNSDYGVEVKRTLIDTGVLRHIIIVDFTQCAFDDALTTACILLCQKTIEAPEFVRFSTVDNVTSLTTSLTNYTSIAINDLDPQIKWKQYYEVTRASKYNHLVPFSTFAKVSRGIATGANDYFTFKPSKKDLYNIPDDCFRPCICHATDVKSQIFTEDNFNQLVNLDKTIYLFDGCANETESHVVNYIRLGIDNEVNKKYLTSSRSPWYALENRTPSPIWVSVFNRNGLRFVRNKANVYNLTTFHCVYNMGKIDTDVLFAYLITDVSKEIFLDNSRQYGNGLVKFEPNDLNKGMVVDLRLLSRDETAFISEVYDRLQYFGTIHQQCIDLLNKLFIDKYCIGNVDLSYYKKSLSKIQLKQEPKVSSIKVKRSKQLNLFDLLDIYGEEPIVENSIARDESVIDGTSTFFNTHSLSHINRTKNLLICNVKEDNWEQYLEGSAKIYYTGKKFPTTVALNKLYYFMPYISGKGIRDLYYIKIARLGYRKEGQENEDKNDLRLVFEIEYLGQLFDDYKMVNLEIWHTFTDTTMDKLIDQVNAIN